MRKNRIVNYRPRSVAYAAAPRNIAAKAQPEKRRGGFPFNPLYTGSAWLGSLTGRAAYSYPDEPKGWIDAAHYNVWASNCVEARQKAIAAAPLKLYQLPADPENEKPKVIQSHEVLDLLESVNPINLDKTGFHETGARQLAIHGAWHTYKVRGSNDKPAELYILPGHLVIPQPDYEDPTNWLAYYQYAGTEALDPRDVIRIYYPRDDDPLYPRSPTSRAVRAINRYNLADLAQEGIDKRGGQGGGVLSPGYDVLTGDFDRFKAEWDAIRSDPNNAGRDMFIAPGFEYKQGVLTAQEQQREERSKRLAKEIMAAYNVPPSLAGDYTDASVLANAAQQSSNFWELWVLPEMRLITEALTVKLLWADWPETRDQGYYLAYDVSQIPALQEDKKERAEVEEINTRTAVARLDGGLSTINQGLAYLGLEPVKDDPRADSIFFAFMARNGVNEMAAADGGADLTNPQVEALREIAAQVAAGELTTKQATAIIKLVAPNIDASTLSDLIPEKKDLATPAPADGQPAEGDQSAEADAMAKPEGLSATELSNIRQAVNQFATGKLTEEQARTMITMAAPNAKPEDVDILLSQAPQTAPAEGEDPEAEPEEEGLTPQEVQTALSILEAQANGVASEDAAAALMALALPGVDPDVITDIVTPEEMDAEEDAAEGEIDDPGAEPIEGEDMAEEDADPIEGELDAAIAEAEAALGGTPEAEPEEPETDAAKAQPKKGQRDPDGIVRNNSGEFASTPGGSGGKSNYSQLKEMAANRRAMSKGKKKGGKKKKAKKAPMTEEQKTAKKREKVQKKLDKINELIKSLEGKEGVDDLRKKLQALAKRADAKLAEIDSGLDALKAMRPETLAVPIVDPVGLLAIDATSGEPLGVVEKVARYGMQGEGEAAVKATKANPVLYIGGKPLLASAVRVLVSPEMLGAVEEGADNA